MSEDICMEFSLDQEFPLGKKMSFEGLTKDTRASSLHQESENQINSFLTISDIHTAKQSKETSLKSYNNDPKKEKKVAKLNYKLTQKNKLNQKTKNKLKLSKNDPDCIEIDPEDLTDIREFLVLPNYFKPMTLEEMKNPNRVFNLNKFGRISTFPMTYSCMISKQEKEELKKTQGKFTKVKSRLIKKRRENYFEGSKGVTLPKLKINWKKQSVKNHFKESLALIKKSKNLNVIAQKLFTRVFILDKETDSLKNALGME